MKDAVAQDAGVVHHAVDATEVVDSGLDDALGALRIGDAVAVGNGDAAGLSDLAHHLIGDLDVRALALGGAAEIVHHHLASLGGGEQSDLTPDTSPGAGDDDDFSINALGHVVASHSLWVKPAPTQHPCDIAPVGPSLRLDPTANFPPASRPTPFNPALPHAECGGAARVSGLTLVLSPWPRGSGSLPGR